jgi:hypothetical protein
VALRAEYYSDRHGVLIATGTPNGFQTAGGSVNVDYLPLKNVLLRLEGRSFNSKDRIFTKSSGTSDVNSAITFALAVGF